ncbi:hypothetical protein D3C87_1391730 [compost metagenome]
MTSDRQSLRLVAVASFSEKSLRKWAPRDSLRKAAKTAIASPTMAGSDAGPFCSASGRSSLIALINPASCLAMPRWRETMGRTTDGSAAERTGVANGVTAVTRFDAGRAAISFAARMPMAAASSRELLASRLAP